MTLLWTSPKFAGLERRLRSKNSEIGLRLANLEVKDWDRTTSKRDPRFKREVRASSGILIRDIAQRWNMPELNVLSFESISCDGEGTGGEKRCVSSLRYLIR